MKKGDWHPPAALPCDHRFLEGTANADQDAARPGFETERQILVLQILALILLGQVDGFQCHAQVIVELITDLRIELPIVAQPPAVAARDIVAALLARTAQPGRRS